MPHWRTLRNPAETLRAYDLVGKDGQPKDFTLKIAKVTMGIMVSLEKPKGDKMPFVYFEGAKKPLGMNVTNCKTVANITGSNDTDKWVGHSVTLYQTKVKSKGGDMSEAIRIRPRAPNGAAEEMPDQPVDHAMIERQHAAAQEPQSTETERGDDPNAY